MRNIFLKPQTDATVAPKASKPRGVLQRFRRAKRGSIAVQFALITVPLLGLLGLGIDGSRALLARYQLQAAVDSSALAVGATIGDKVKLQAMMDALVRKNFNVAGATVETVTLGGVGLEVHVNSSAKVDMIFARAIGRENIVVDVSTEVKRASGGLMVSMALDNTGSMWSGNNIGALREATISLLDEVFSDDKTPDDLRVSLVPYSSAVNVGDEWSSLINKAALDAEYTKYLGYVPPLAETRQDTWIKYWKGCVLERPDYAMADTAPDATDTDTLWEPFWYPPGDDNNYDPKDASTIKVGGLKSSNQITGPNIGCPTPITPLTNKYDTLKTAADALTGWNRGGTLTDIGVAWAYRVLTPGAPFTQSTEKDPRDDKTLWASERWRKAVIIMTDGESQFWQITGNGSPNKELSGVKSDYTGYGRLGEARSNTINNNKTSKNAARDEVNKRIAAKCEVMKNQDILVYTVVFTSRVNNTTREMYKDCATDPGKHWYAPDKNALKGAFKAIGGDLAKLRITR